MLYNPDCSLAKQYIKNSSTPYVSGKYSMFQENETYISSQNIHYKKYPLDELKIYCSGLLYNIIFIVYTILTCWLDLTCVYYNNLLVSTGLYEKKFYENISNNSFDEIFYLQKPIVIRNILFENCHIFEKYGFKRIASRHVNIVRNPNSLTKKYRQKINWDRNILRRLLDSGKFVIKAYNSTPDIQFTRVEKNDIPINELKNLYSMLYLNKYSKYNPDFTTDFIDYFISCSNTGLIWIEYNNVPIGVAGYYIVDNYLTTPLFGYDLDFNSFETKDASINYSLYRALSVLINLEAKRLNKIEHRSGGCKGFKKQRGANGEIEYIMVKYDHIRNISFTNIICKLSWMYLHIITLLIELIYNH